MIEPFTLHILLGVALPAEGQKYRYGDKIINVAKVLDTKVVLNEANIPTGFDVRVLTEMPTIYLRDELHAVERDVVAVYESDPLVAGSYNRLNIQYWMSKLGGDAKLSDVLSLADDLPSTETITRVFRDLANTRKVIEVPQAIKDKRRGRRNSFKRYYGSTSRR